MKCQLRFFGGVSAAADNIEATEFSFAGGTLGDLLDQMQKKWPGLEEYISGRSRGAIICILNERALNLVNRDLPLSDGDKLTLMPFIGGG